MMLAIKGRAMPMADAVTEGRRSDGPIGDQRFGGEPGASTPGASTPGTGAHASPQRSAPVLKLRPILGPRPDRTPDQSDDFERSGSDGGEMRAVYRSRKVESRKRFTFRLQADRHAALMAAARERGVSANALLTDALVPVLGPDQGASSGGSGR